VVRDKQRRGNSLLFDSLNLSLLSTDPDLVHSPEEGLQHFQRSYGKLRVQILVALDNRSVRSPVL
jgi:hypothetical protein